MSTDDDPVAHYLHRARAILLSLLGCAYTFVACWLLVVSTLLLCRYLRLRLGRRTKPSGKRAILITGATSGIGLGLAKRFHRQGFTVIAAYYNAQEPGHAELQEIVASQQDHSTGRGPDSARLFLVHMDVRSEQSIDEAADEIDRLLRKFGIRLHCVVCNAGLANDCCFEINRLDNMLRLVQTNFAGTVMVAKRFTLPIIKSRGRIVLVSSIFHNLITPSTAIYSATKAAVKSLADSLNEDLKRYGASCRCVCPGVLMNKSNLIFTASTSLRDCVSRLSDEERDMYKDAIADNTRAIDKQVKLRLNQLKEDPDQLPGSYIIDLSDLKHEFRFTRATIIRDSMFDCLVGSQSGFKSTTKTDVDEMGALTAFDDAVCMHDPPRRCYSGNKLYQYVTGPILGEYLPQVLLTANYAFLEDRFRGNI